MTDSISRLSDEEFEALVARVKATHAQVALPEATDASVSQEPAGATETPDTPEDDPLALYKQQSRAAFAEVEAFQQEVERSRMLRDRKATELMGAASYDSLGMAAQARVRAAIELDADRATGPIEEQPLSPADLDQESFEALVKAATGNGYPLSQLTPAQRAQARRFMAEDE